MNDVLSHGGKRVVKDALAKLRQEIADNGEGAQLPALTLTEFLGDEAAVRDALMHPFLHIVAALEALKQHRSDAEAKRLQVLYPAGIPPKVVIPGLCDTDYVVAQLVDAVKGIFVGRERLRHLLYLQGPAGCGKTTLLEFLSGLLTGARTFHIEGSPYHESALYLLSPEQQHELAEAFGISHVPGRPCKEVTVKSLSNHKVIAVDLAQLAWNAAVQLGNDSEANVAALLDALRVGHGALIQIDHLAEHIEDVVGLLHAVLAGEGYTLAGKAGRFSIAPAMIATGNKPVLGKLKAGSHPLDEPMRQRTILIIMPMILRFREQLRSLRDQFATHDLVAGSPRFLELIAAVAVLSRYTNEGDHERIVRLFLYEGEIYYHNGYDARKSMHELRSAYPNDGTEDEGSLCPREVVALVQACIVGCEHDAWLPWILLERLRGNGQEPIFPNKKFKNVLGDAEKVLWGILLLDVLEAFAPGEIERRAKELATIYMRHLSVFRGVPDEEEGFTFDPGVLVATQAAIGIFRESAPEDMQSGERSEAGMLFQNIVIPSLSDIARAGGRAQGGKPPIADVLLHATRLQAIELARMRLMEMLSKDRTDAEAQEEYEGLVARLVKIGYSEGGARALLKKGAEKFKEKPPFIPFPLD